MKEQVAEMYGKKERASLDIFVGFEITELENKLVFVATCCCGHAGRENGGMT